MSQARTAATLTDCFLFSLLGDFKGGGFSLFSPSELDFRSET